MARFRKRTLDLPEKANKILNGILIVFLLILFRVWHLATVQHEEKLAESLKPQKKTVVKRVERAPIVDRFGVPLALNRVQYNAELSYGAIRQLPRWVWKINDQGKRVKYFLRKDYIHQLAQYIARILHLDSEKIEDIIHSKAAILGNAPYLLKENISEETYFQLKMAEKKWPGLRAEIVAKRHYPLGPVGGHIVGYIGPISREEYEGMTRQLSEMRGALSHFEKEGTLPEGFHSLEEIQQQLEELEKKAYAINDLVGKTGVEAAFDTILRGARGKSYYLSDSKGNFLQTLAGEEASIPGKALTLTLSAELQEYAENLLLRYEGAAPHQLKGMPLSQPWIKGGAIIALDPESGEILAMASYPRFDPNDFIRLGEDFLSQKNSKVNQWLENEAYLAEIWDYKTPLSREQVKGFDEKELDWDFYLSLILPEQSSVFNSLKRFSYLKDAIWVQQQLEHLLTLFHSDAYDINAAKIIDYLYSATPHILTGGITTLQELAFFKERESLIKESVAEVKRNLEPYFKSLPLNYEKLLLVDLYRVVVQGEGLSPDLADLVGSMTLGEYRETGGRLALVQGALKNLVRELYHENHFKKWRYEFFPDFLIRKRAEEKALKVKFARPYIDFLQDEEREQFSIFWEKYRWDFLLLFLQGSSLREDKELRPYLRAIKEWYQEIQAGAHTALSWIKSYKRLAQLSEDFEEGVLIDYFKTFRSFDELDRPLYGLYTGLRGKKEKHLAAAFYPTYGYGFARSHAFRQAATVGSIFKLVPAYEALRQNYNKKEEKGESFRNLNPLVMVDDKHRVWNKQESWNVGFTAEGRPIPVYYKGGRLPRSDHAGVGKIDLVGALEASSNPYFALLAGDVLEDPEDLREAARLFGFGEKTGIDLPGEYTGYLPYDIVYNRTGLYAMAIGQHALVGTPLQVSILISALGNRGEILKPQVVKGPKEVRWEVFLPPQIQEPLLQGLKQVILGEKGTARSLKKQFPPALIQQIIGKTSTAEALERLSLDGSSGRIKCNHVWFGAISYEDEKLKKPELVVVVYLRHGEYGWGAAPLAVKMVQKWRAIVAAQGSK